MEQKRFDEIVDTTIASIRQLLVVKGGEYAGSEDRLANFKRGAKLSGVAPLTVLFIYLSKHYDSFATYVRDKQTTTERPRSESMHGRLDDIINYCILAKAIIAEEADFAPGSYHEVTLTNDGVLPQMKEGESMPDYYIRLTRWTKERQNSRR